MSGWPAPFDEEARCVACGEPIDYCQGHGELGDPDGRLILLAHDMGVHRGCDLRACPDAPNPNGL